MQAPGLTDSSLHHSALWTSALDSSSGCWAVVPESHSTQPKKEEAAPNSFSLSHLLSLTFSLFLYQGPETLPHKSPSTFLLLFHGEIGHKLLPKPIWGKQAPVNHSGPPLELGWDQLATGTWSQGDEEGT